VATIIGGDNWVATNPTDAQPAIRAALEQHRPDILVAGPAFNAGRYGVACAEACLAVEAALGVPTVASMYADNPAAGIYRQRLYLTPSGEHASSMAELERAKAEFLNLASHELRGPLTVIRGYNSMLEDGSIPPDQVAPVARLLEAKLAQMDLLIEEMLETARLEHDRLELSRERFDVRWVAQEQLDIFRPLALGHHFVVDAAREPLLVDGDRSRIATILANFMDNAIKYSPAGGEICVMSGHRETDVFVSVRDHGIGISREHMPRLFTRFGRLPTEQNVSIAGTGLGLFLCKEIAVRHGGDITVNSRPGVGSEFTLTLPSAR